MDKRIKEIEQSIDQRIIEIEKRITELNLRMDKLEQEWEVERFIDRNNQAMDKLQYPRANALPSQTKANPEPNP
jgi:hypothetical protein